MARATLIQTNFTGGELSPRLDGRVDIAKYFNGCRRCENMIVLPHGGAGRRGGTRHIAPAVDDAVPSRLIPFRFSTTQAYVLEFGHQVIRVFTEGGIVETAPGVPLEIASPYTSAEIDQLDFAQSADILYLAHENHAPRTLKRTSHIAWTLETITFTSPPADWAAGDYPGCVGFFEQRLVWARSPSKPQTLWFSKTGDYQNHGVSDPVVDDDALTYTIASGEVNRIAWIAPGKVLAIGTAGAEFVASGAGTSEAISPNSVRIVPETTFGSASVRPLRVGPAVLFLQEQRRKLREMVYSFDIDGHVAPDLTLLAEHVSLGGLTALAYQQEPDSVLWAVRSDGLLLGCTYQRDQEVVAWHRHVLGGQLDGGPTRVESLAVIPGDGRDALWLAVARTIGGSTHRTIERLEPMLGIDGDAADAFYVDGGLTYDGAPTGLIGGLAHLEGETVEVLADGARRAPAVVTGGQIAIAPAASKVHAGLGFRWALSTMRLEGAARGGTAQGQAKRISDVTVRFFRSLGVRIGAPGDIADAIHFRATDDPMDAPPPLFTGDRRVSFPAGWERDGIVEISGEGPFPATVIAIMPTVRSSG